ncbi:Exosome complex exonuclease RRP46-like protein [Morus notabilis]|uniref:Exosome complex exonuclease RRP46 homolog n=1 Tax=Morus notabilis TaxID=981085 RepID=W9QKI3_9ROSA|nr:Exosome complex exonuclease RRP46-like protein [Morus notabilis]
MEDSAAADTADVGGSVVEENECRICRNPGEEGNPLRYPCACRGTIKYVHQDCLLQWLNHRKISHCERKIAMEIDRIDGRTPNQLRPLACSRNVLNRAHGSASWSQGDTKVLAAVYGPKAGTKKHENPEKACIEVIWKPKTGQTGKSEREYEMILKRTLQSICILTVNPNTTTSVIIQVVNDDGAVSFKDAGIPLKHLAGSNTYVVNDDGAVSFKVAICCGLAESGYVILDPAKLEEQKMKAFAYLVFPNSVLSALPEGSPKVEGEPMENGIITSVTQGAMAVDDYFHCLERGRAANEKMSAFLRRSLQPQLPG